MNWQPIAAFDVIPAKDRPKLALFYFSGTPPLRGQKSKYGMVPIVEQTRFYGNRECTHFLVIPPPPGDFA